jgi:hypothetical protein
LPAQENLLAQHFQRAYGTSLNNTFTKVLRSGTGYYVLGSDEPSAGAQPRATVMRLDAQGQHQWTLRLDIASQWNDAVVTPNGNLLVVGHTLPFGANNRSLAALVTSAGSFSWVRSYDVPGAEGFHRIIRHVKSSPHPYYVAGTERRSDGGFTSEELVLFTLNESGGVGWRRRYYSNPLNHYPVTGVRDLEALPNGDLVLAGHLGDFGVVMQLRDTGVIYNAVGSEAFTFGDVTRTGDGFLAVGNTFFPLVSAYLMKFTPDLHVRWQIKLPDLKDVSQVWRDGADGIYVVGRASVNGIERGVVLKFQDFGDDPAAFLWMKYLENNEVAYTGGNAWYVPPASMAFADGRVRPDGFGGEDAFLSVSDLELNTCMTVEGFAHTLGGDLLFHGVLVPEPEPVDMPVGVNVTMHSKVNWREEDACPQNGSIVGKVYHYCGDTLKPKPKPTKWPKNLIRVKLLSLTGSLIAEQYADSTGGYAFSSLPSGFYRCRVELPSEWRHHFPSSGEYVVEVKNTQVVRDFYLCPECSCDKVYVDVVPVQDTSSDEFVLMVIGEGVYAYCFDAIDITLNQGAFESVIPAPGWTVAVVDSHHVRLHVADRDSWPPLVFHRVKPKTKSVLNALLSVWVYSSEYGNPCERAFPLPFPLPVRPTSCCPAGSVPDTTNLVQNGDFEQGNTGFTSGYTYFPPGVVGPGKYSVMNAAQVYAANNQWACLDHTTSLPAGMMLVIDGSPNAPSIAWQQTVNVTAGVKYSFSAWFNNLVRPPFDYGDPQVALFVGNTQISGTLTLPETPDQWVYLCDTFLATSTGPVVLSIRVLSSHAIGNDLAIDDVSFKACRAAPCASLPSGMTAWWSLNETSGPSNDLMGTNNAGVWINNPTPVAGVVGGALRFPAGNATTYVDVPNHPEVNFGTNDFTIDAWIKLGPTPGDIYPIVDKLDGSLNGAGYFWVIQGGQFLFMLSHPQGPNLPNVLVGVASTFSTPITLGTWHHVAITVKRTASQTFVTFYLDGAQNGPFATGPSVPITTSLNSGVSLWIGSLRGGSNLGEITIDELEFFHRELSAGEIQSIYSAGPQGKCKCVPPPSGMVAWYPFDEQSGANLVQDLVASNVGVSQPAPVGMGGPMPITGLVGAGALYFPGPNTYADVAHQPGLNFTDFSIDAWVKVVPCGPGFLSPIVDKWDPVTNSGFVFYVEQIGNPLAAHLRLRINNSTFTSSASFAAVNPWTGPWVHVAVTVNRSAPSPTGTFYINGVPAGTFTPPPANVSIINNLSMWMGKTRIGGGICELAIDELELFNRPLTPSEINHIWAAGKLGKCRATQSVCSCRPNAFGHVGYIATSGAIWPLSCGDSVEWSCQLPTFDLVGAFVCQGNICPPNPNMFWTLTHLNSGTVVAQGGMTGPHFSVSIPSSTFSQGGTYTLALGGVCGNDTCYCFVRINTPGCDCRCDPTTPWSLGLTSGNSSYIIQCGNTVNVAPGATFHPTFNCIGSTPNCGIVKWTLTGPGSYFQSGSAQNLPGTFVIPPLSPINFTTPGTYTLQMVGICGWDTCSPCTVYFCVLPPAPFVKDTFLCQTQQSAIIPLQNCPTSCNISEVKWFIKPCSASAWPSWPYQVSSAGNPPNCDGLVFLPYQYPNDSCVQVYAVVELAPGCCVSSLTTNVATITLCKPVGCQINNPNPEFCQTTGPLLPLTGVPLNANCNYNVEWYNENNQLVSTSLTYTPPPLTFPTNSTACYKDFLFTLKITGVCGPSTCTTAIRVFNINTNNGDLIMQPLEPQPFCPGEDAILVYNNYCSGPPPKWQWYASTVSASSGFNLIPGSGTMNPVFYTNQLYQTTWFMVESQNGVCPSQKDVLQINVKPSINITGFTVTPDPCIETQAQLMVAFTPSPIAGAGCQYIIDWYHNGNLVHTNVVSTSPASYLYQGPNVSGVYYAVVQDKCCPGAVQTSPVVIPPACKPVIQGPCYKCDMTTPVVLSGSMVIPPKDACPSNVVCTYQWYKLDVVPHPDVWVPLPGQTNPTLTITTGGQYKLETKCDYGYGICTQEAYHTVAQCIGCTFVDDEEVPLPQEWQVTLQPNPTADEVTVQIAPIPLQKGRVEVIDLNGRVLVSSRVPEAQSSVTFSLASLSAGLYVVRVFESEVLLWTGKVVRSE